MDSTGSIPHTRDTVPEPKRVRITDDASLKIAEELFGMVRRLSALGLHVDAQALQSKANIFWVRGLGRAAP
jgi:hypothetical protein